MTIPTTFKSNFDSVLSAVSDNALYTDIKKWKEEGIIDTKTFKELILGFHRNVLAEALSTAKELMLSMQEVEITNADGTKTKHTLQQVQILEALEKVAFAKQQTLTEKERTALIKAQKDGFFDNRIIKLTETMRGLVGEIEAGGLENPQENWDMLYSSLNAMATIASEHPLVGAIAVPTTVPAGKTVVP